MRTEIAILMPIIFCGDEISDILYLILNWDNFANEDLKNAALAFTIINGIICAFPTILVIYYFKGLEKPDGVKVFAMICLCGWIPIYAIAFVMVWGKFIHLFDTLDCLERVLVREGKQVFKKLVICLTYAEIFLEDLPQIIIQSINNTEANQWELFEFISLGLSIATITFEIIKFMLCREREEEISGLSMNSF